MSNGVRWTVDEYEQYLRNQKHDKTNANPAVPAANVERDPKHAAKAADEGQKVDPRFCIRFHSVRRRLTDPDGLYAKAAIDGLTEGGILEDDNARIVKEISYTQELVDDGEAEETIIIVEEIPED